MDRLALSFVFGLGVIAQIALFLINSGAENVIPRVVMAAGTGLFGLLPGKRERDYVGNFYMHVCFCFICYAFMIFALFKKEIMAKVSESNLLCSSLVFWYLCATYFYGSAPQEIVMGLAVLPTVMTLVVAFTIREWSFWLKLFCYVWFLVLMVAISFFQIRFGNLAFVFTESYDPPSAVSLFLTGMAFAYLTGSVFYIYILIPFEKKHQTHAQRMAVWRQDTRSMVSCFADYRMTSSQAVTIIAVQGGLYAANYYYRLVSVPVMMNASLLGLPYAFAYLFRNPPLVEKSQ